MSVAPSISTLISDYEGTSATMPIVELLRVQDKLSTYLYRLAEEAAEAKKDYNWAYFTRKVAINRSKQALINKMAVNKSEIMAETENKDKLEAEITEEALAYKLDLLLRQGNKVLSAMQQRISYLKQEFSAKQFAG